MHNNTTGFMNTRHSFDCIARVIAIMAIAAAVLALIIPVSFSGPHTSTINVAAGAQATVVPSGKLADGERVPRFFGFLEYDWDPDAPGGVPGFDPSPQTPQHP
jgi:hypothetical protein